ncbi:FUSC family protein [Pseudalkalibacillus caeni]|uniref:FUSC family protein n=1 Tax=Exobacillus caeni TaxID=2574798 RepID=A0A5R9F3R2_9BACL|nr:FUSC family protein [Pseudalkalibacillus caeni]
MLASDPGRKRLNQAGKAVISLLSSVTAVILFLKVAGISPLKPAIVAGITGMMGIMVVVDDTKEEKKVTTLLLGVSAALGITFGSLLASNSFLVGALMVTILFSAFYFTKFGSRYFSLGMIGFMTVYFSAFLKLKAGQFPYFYMGIAIGVAFAYLINFVLFKDSAQLLRRSMRSFHIQANLTFQILIEIIQDPETKESRLNKLNYNVDKLRQYANHVSSDLNVHDVKELWPGLTSSQLKLYVFDTAMLVETLAESLQRLKKDKAFEKESIRELIIKVITSLRKAEVLNNQYQPEYLIGAQKATLELRKLIKTLFAEQTMLSGGYLYLLRRIESIATHVTTGGLQIQQALNAEPPKIKEEDKKTAQEGEEEEKDNEEDGLKPSTKKAFQALAGGILALIVGFIISPVQPYWVILTSFIILIGTESVGRIYLKGLQRSIGTVIGAILGFGLAKMISGYSEIEILLLFLLLFFAFYLLAVSYTIMSVFITMLIAFMYDLLLGGISFSLLGARVIDTFAGAAISLLVAAFLFPTRTKDKISETFIDYLDELESYVSQYLKSFNNEATSIKKLADSAFQLDEKIQAIKDQSEPMLRQPGAKRNAELSSWITLFTAINYYAKHLVASSYKKHFTNQKEIEELFPAIEEKINHNISTLKELIHIQAPAKRLYHLRSEREHVERLFPEQNDLLHHMYYIWRINQSLLLLGNKLGAKSKD